ncbi:uncharacterized protein N7515_000326 [Penicillium bovifimosum]|uniref:Uncharacterized protein n=1 Tax=Penicillium bovifimosum TaxID=126998 RepID=A0A9W9HF70_9EURO|nr:uncharacterized protein N7515_000326 [Penicillium bovifimosum]KAJ5145762.1 hypothetical protein N7515_000326 [Penicillium bovifimosum]
MTAEESAPTHSVLSEADPSCMSASGVAVATGRAGDWTPGFDDQKRSLCRPICPAALLQPVHG